MSEYITSREFDEHAKNEEHNQRVTNDALHEGNIRMGNIEAELKELALDLKPLLRLYHAVLGAGTIGAMLMALVVFIYNQDRESIKQIGESVQRQGIVIEKLISKHDEFEKDSRREFERIEKALEKAGKM